MAAKPWKTQKANCRYYSPIRARAWAMLCIIRNLESANTRALIQAIRSIPINSNGVSSTITADSLTIRSSRICSRQVNRAVPPHWFPVLWFRNLPMLKRSALWADRFTWNSININWTLEPIRKSPFSLVQMPKGTNRTRNLHRPNFSRTFPKDWLRLKTYLSPLVKPIQFKA